MAEEEGVDDAEELDDALGDEFWSEALEEHAETPATRARETAAKDAVRRITDIRNSNLISAQVTRRSARTIAKYSES